MRLVVSLLCAWVLLATPATAYKGFKYGEGGGFRAFVISDAAISAVGDHIGCNPSRVAFSALPEDTCSVPPGKKVRFLSFTVSIPQVLTSPVGTCRLGIAVEGVAIAELLVITGDADLDQAGESKISTAANPAFHPAGSRFEIIVIDLAAAIGDCDNTSALRQVMVTYRWEMLDA